jgi:eukaryotic-like serine/threonine-protein kinase
MSCSVCGGEHAADQPCPNVPNKSSGTLAGQPGGPVGEVDPLIGTHLGSFKIVRLLGRGGMGTVYLGEQTIIGSKVAVKVLHDHLASNASLVKRFYDEARAVNVIGHENIVNVIDLQTTPRYYMVMEYLEGTPLNVLIRGPIASKLAIPILIQACDALQSAHQHGVIHRDLKPENIFLVKRGRRDNVVKILDFGIAKLFSEGHTEGTQVGMIVGTPEYMAPEQANNEAVDGRTDLYSLGIIAYLMAVGRLPFFGGGLTGLLLAHRTQVPEAPHLANPDVTPELSAVIMKALEKQKENRFPDANAFADALDAAFRAEPERSAKAGPPGLFSALLDAPPPPSASAPPVPQPSSPPPPVSAPSPAPSGPPIVQGTPLVSPQPPPPAASAVMRGPSPVPVSAVPVGPFPTLAHPPGIPTNLETPEPVHPRHAATFDATVMDLAGHPLGALRCRDISRGGMFLCSDGPFPAVFSRVRIRLPIAGDFECLAEVVRHVSQEQAAAWKMSPGFGVQFLNIDGPRREALARLTSSLPVSRPSAPLSADDDDPIAGKLLAQYAKRVNGDHYVVLALMPDAEFAEVRARGRDVKKELDLLKQRPISSKQRAQIDTLASRMQLAVDCIGNAATRVEYDSNRANFRGVARCIAAGITAAELNTMRTKFLHSHPGAEAQAQVKWTMGTTWEKKGTMALAFEAWESALSLDPINLSFHQHYWSARSKTQGK